jgi:hypothetical protein
MSRIKRWLNMHGKEFNLDGTLKNEARERMLSIGMSNEAIDDYAARLKAKYEHLKLLDETEPEQLVEYTTYDFFTEEEKRQFNPDGSLKPEFVEYARTIGISEEALEEMERRKKIDVDNYNELSARYVEQGINFGEQQMKARIADSKSYLQRREQMEIDLRNFEEVDSLPFDKDTAY